MRDQMSQGKAEDVYESTDGIGDKEYKEQMADQSKPLSLEAIVEYNKRRGNN